MYESLSQKPIPPNQFRLRLIKHALLALLILAASLGLGTFGYVYFENMAWQEAFLNASMLLSGIGLAHFPDSPAGQLFISIFALYSGLVFLMITSIVIAPILHRFLHRFHWTEEN